MTLNAKIGDFMDFLAISGCDTSLYHSQGGATVLSLCALRHDCIKDVVFYPKFPQIWLKQRQIFVVRFRCILNAIIYYLVHFWCTVFGETVCISYSVICDILFDDAVTSGIGSQRPALTTAGWLHWLSCYIFTLESSYCFHRVLATTILSDCLSVCPFIRHTGESVKSGAN